MKIRTALFCCIAGLGVATTGWCGPFLEVGLQQNTLNGVQLQTNQYSPRVSLGWYGIIPNVPFSWMVEAGMTQGGTFITTQEHNETPDTYTYDNMLDGFVGVCYLEKQFGVLAQYGLIEQTANFTSLNGIASKSGRTGAVRLGIVYQYNQHVQILGTYTMSASKSVPSVTIDPETFKGEVTSLPSINSVGVSIALLL